MLKRNGVCAPTTGSVTLLVATRKGGFMLHGNRARNRWKLAGPFVLGSIVHHMVADPRDGATILMAARTGHLGPTVFRSCDIGATWTEARTPPAFPKAPESEKGESVHHVFWLSSGHALEPRVWYAGSSPPGLFRSLDGGETWEGVPGFNEHPMRRQWIGTLQDAPPGGATLHSIQIDPRNPNHIYFGISTAGVFESSDGGEDWKPLNKGCAADFIPVPDPEYGHDPHCLQMHSLVPDRLYQQNHCGIYRMERAEGAWVRIGENMPKEVGDIGFPLALHPRDPDVAWVFPMDSTMVWPRTNVSGCPAAYVTRDGGETWQKQNEGLAKQQAWYNVKRQALTTDRHDPVGVYFGTTNGELWGSTDEGDSWALLVKDLPEVYAVEVMEHIR
ncbi:MAG: glycosyl hydrolase [Chloroflexi bacterium]|nr:glycosyl hydrolase [Chloroflexota bacterium]